MALNPCVLTNVLANDYAKAVNAVNRKFNALRRMAELLEQLGDISGFIPDIGALIPIYMINLDAYANLVAACPFLNLPKSPSTEDIGALQAQVAAAYARLVGQLMQHPWLRMGQLQDQMNKVQGQVNEALNKGAQFMQCLQQACASVASVSDTVKNFEEYSKDYAKTYLANNGKVINNAMAGKLSQVQGSIDNVNELISARPFNDTAVDTTGRVGGVIPSISPATVRAVTIPQLPPNPPINTNFPL